MWFEKLNLTKDKLWLNETKFQEIEEECEKKPMQLVAAQLFVKNLSNGTSQL